MKVNVSFDEDPKTLPVRFGEIYLAGAFDWHDLKNRPFYDNEDGTVAKQLDDKYLPMLEITHSVDVLPEQDVTFEFDEVRYICESTNISNASLSLNIGEIYKVEFDGVVYECTATIDAPAWDITNTVEHLGGFGWNSLNLELPFGVFCGEEWGGVTIYCVGSGPCTKKVRIYQGEDSCKIKPEYLPLYNGEVESV